uniref:RNA-directed DNA polymerase n=1 Tax=Anoplophora glabripennis TaxID=217634 RepID=V5GGL8_ANOGL
MNLYKTQSLIEYSKIEFSNEQLLDKNNKNIVTFFQQNNLKDFHYKIIEDLFEENADFCNLKLNKLSSKSVRNRNYFIVALPFDADSVIQHLFASLYNGREEFKNSEKYCIENNLDLPVLEILSFLLAEKDVKLKICQDITRTPNADEIPIIIDQYHSGKAHLHRGINETIRRIRGKYNWKGLTKDVEKYIKQCETCQKTKACRKNLDSPLVITETPKAPFERINIDILEVPTKNYALTIRDELTKFSQAYPISDKSAKSVVNTLLVYFQHFGTPLRIHCDYGREFDNATLRDLCNLYDIKITYSSVGHPQSNGSLERFHSTLLEMIRIHVTDHPDEHPFNILPYAVICYNNSTNKTHGFTPYELVFGHTSSRPPETLYNQKELVTKYVRDLNNRLSYYYKVARTRTEAQKQKAKIRFDTHVSKEPPEYQIGQKVYLKESQITNKLHNKFNGPFEILELHKNSATLLNPKTKQRTKVNFDRLKPHFEA